MFLGILQKPKYLGFLQPISTALDHAQHNFYLKIKGIQSTKNFLCNVPMYM